jgi:hypothetical protein
MSPHLIGCELEAIAQAYEQCVHGIGKADHHLKNVQELFEIARWMK